MVPYEHPMDPTLTTQNIRGTSDEYYRKITKYIINGIWMVWEKYPEDIMNHPKKQWKQSKIHGRTSHGIEEIKKGNKLVKIKEIIIYN